MIKIVTLTFRESALSRRISSAFVFAGTKFGASATKTIKKNGYIRMKTMEKICKYLKCQADDIIEFK